MAIRLPARCGEFHDQSARAKGPGLLGPLFVDSSLPVLFGHGAQANQRAVERRVANDV
jgi:hypothetical protein